MHSVLHHLQNACDTLDLSGLYPVIMTCQTALTSPQFLFSFIANMTVQGLRSKH